MSTYVQRQYDKYLYTKDKYNLPHVEPKPLPTGGWVQDFFGQADAIDKMQKLARDIENQKFPKKIPYKQAYQIADYAWQTYKTISNMLGSMLTDPTFLLEMPQINQALERLYTAQRYYFDMTRAVKAQQANKGMVDGYAFEVGISRMVRAFNDAVEDVKNISEARPLMLRYMPKTVELLTTIGGAIVVAVKTTDEYVLQPSLKVLQATETAMNWAVYGTIGVGALYIFSKLGSR